MFMGICIHVPHAFLMLQRSLKSELAHQELEL